MYQLQQPDDSNSVPIKRPPYNPHSLEEFRRLHILHRHLYHLMGGLLPRAFNHDAFRARFRDRFGSYYRVLDIGCGAGGWVLDMVRANSETVVYGIDTDAYLIKQAKEHARREGLHEARFRVQQLDDLSWSEDMHMANDGPFHLIHMRFVACRLLPEQLPGLVRSVIEHCNPHGCIVWTEMELPISNSSDFERYTALIIQALKASGCVFSPGSSLGITPLLGPLLYDAGYDEIQNYTTFIDLSYKPYLRFEFIEQMFAIGHTLKPFILASGITAEEAYDEILEAAMIAVSEDSFCGQSILRTIVSNSNT